MNCQLVADWLDDHEPELASLGEREALGEHLSECADCRDAWHASWALRALAAGLPRVQPRPGLFEKVRSRASQIATSGRTRSSWLGGAAAAIAASFVVSLLSLTLLTDGRTPAGINVLPRPMIAFALHEAREVSVAIESGQALVDAAVRVSLSEGLELVGFEGRREISWHTDIDRGVNRLTLPIAALAAGSGRLLVEVEHEHKRETFIVEIDVRIS